MGCRSGDRGAANPQEATWASLARLLGARPWSGSAMKGDEAPQPLLRRASHRPLRAGARGAPSGRPGKRVNGQNKIVRELARACLREMQ
jgi:hypothetical protein